MYYAVVKCEAMQNYIKQLYDRDDNVKKVKESLDYESFLFVHYSAVDVEKVIDKLNDSMGIDYSWGSRLRMPF